jgi:FkbM family methyltransferase
VTRLDSQTLAAVAPRPSFPRLRFLASTIAASSRLGATLPDKLRYFTAVYLDRLRSHAPRLVRSRPIELTVSGPRGPVAVALRLNGADWNVLRCIFDEKEYAVPIPSARSILDLGANCGFGALYFANLFPEAQIACVEPVPWNIRALRKTIEMNGLPAHVIEAAVATDDGEGELYMTGNDNCESLIAVHRWSHRLRVPTLTVPTIMRRLGWDHVDLLKIDIEGYEKQLFSNRPDWLEWIGSITGELHGDYDVRQLREDLASFGFRVSPLCDGYEKTFWAFRGHF